MSTKKILLVDDDKDLLRGMSVSFKASGYNVVSAQDGVSAMSAARREQPDLIVLDIGLPGGDGFQVMEWLNNLDHRIPVIVVSARQAEPNQKRALNAGAMAFFQKPVDRPKFMEAVRAVLDAPVLAESAKE
jgi:two-component system KDP operon response regulator KdpE